MPRSFAFTPGKFLPVVEVSSSDEIFAEEEVPSDFSLADVDHGSFGDESVDSSVALVACDNSAVCYNPDVVNGSASVPVVDVNASITVSCGDDNLELPSGTVYGCHCTLRFFSVLAVPKLSQYLLAGDVFAFRDHNCNSCPLCQFAKSCEDKNVVFTDTRSDNSRKSVCPRMDPRFPPVVPISPGHRLLAALSPSGSGRFSPWLLRSLR
jgi:hypothetical protein